MVSDIEKQLGDFLAKLNTRSKVGWRPEFRLGRPLYDFLIDALKSGRLLPHQTANALVVVFRLRALGTGIDLLEVLRQALSHRSIVVRTRAATLLIGLMRFNDWRPPFVSAATREALVEALRLGVYKDTGQFVTRFLERGPEGVPIR